MVARVRHRLVLDSLTAQNSDSSLSPPNTGPYQYEQRVRSSDSENDFLSPHWQANGVVGDRIPGFKTSATFLSSLRTNLRLVVSPPPSPMSTPPSMQASTSSLPPPSPLSQSTELPPSPAATDPLAEIPPLKNYTTTDEDERTAALKLVADSVAQMRQTASRSLIFHPLNISVYIATLAVLYRFMVKSPSDYGLFGSTVAGVTMSFLVTVRYMTAPHIEFAERVNASLLENADVIVAKFGDEVIGAIILGWVPADSRGKRRKGWRIEIRGWVVRLRYRGKGVGMSLLEDAVEEAKRKGVEDIEFAEDHPNSGRVLWPMYNGAFDRNEQKARKTLQELWDSSHKGKKR